MEKRGNLCDKGLNPRYQLIEDPPPPKKNILK